MSRPFVVDGPEITHTRQAEHVCIGGSADVQQLGTYTSKNYRMFWATEAEVNAKVVEIINDGWVLDGEPNMSPIYPPLDLYNCSISAHKHTIL